MFSETRYARNGDLRVAYRASPPGARDIVLVCPPFTNCEAFLDLPYFQAWSEAMASLGRLIFFDHPGTGVSDPATPTLELWADSINAVLGDLGSGEAVLVAIGRQVIHEGGLGRRRYSRSCRHPTMLTYRLVGGTKHPQEDANGFRRRAHR